MIHLNSANHRFPAGDMGVQESIRFEFDPAAPEAVPDALFLREVVRHHSVGLPPEALDEAAMLADRAVDASLTMTEAIIFDVKIPKEAPQPEDAVEVDMRALMDAQDADPLYERKNSIEQELRRGGCDAIVFKGAAAAVTLSGLARLTHYKRRSFDPDTRAMRKQARHVATRYLGVSYPFHNLVSRVVDVAQGIRVR